jgi:hypothetical protein
MHCGAVAQWIRRFRANSRRSGSNKDGHRADQHPEVGMWEVIAIVLTGNPEAIETASGLTKILERWRVRQRRKCVFSLHPDESIGYCGQHVLCRGTPKRKAFSYNKRTMDRAMSLAVVAVPRINNLRAVNTLNSPTPAASTTLPINYRLRDRYRSQCSGSRTAAQKSLA